MKYLKQNNTLVIIPVFNEGKNIGKVIDDLFINCKDADVLVVNDGSYDKTAEVLKNKPVFVMTHIFNLGIGASLQTAYQFAAEKGYDYVVRMDGDGQHDPAFIKTILAPVKNDEADVTIGSRFLGRSEIKSTFSRTIGIAAISWFLMAITKKKITDPTSGFCAMDRKAFEFFSENYADDYPEPEIIIYHKEYRIKEVPISINKRYAGVSSITPFKSIYYMIKVFLSLFVHIFGKPARLSVDRQDRQAGRKR